MSLRHLLKSPLLSLLSLLILFLSPTVRSAVIEPESGIGGKQSILEMIFKMPALGDTRGVSGAQAINSVEKAKKALSILEEQLSKKGEIASVIPLAPRIIEFLPQEPGIHYLYAIALAAQGDAQSADGELRQVNQKHKENLLGLLALSSKAKAKKQWKLAAQYAEMAINTTPAHPYAYNILGQVKVAEGRYADALKIFSAATEHAPQFIAAYSNLGSVYLLMGKYKEAQEAFSNALNQYSDYCPALIGRANVALHLNKIPNAVSDLERCVKADENQRIARRELVNTYILYGALQKASDLSTASLDQDPAFFNMKLAEIQLRLNNPAGAREHLKSIASPDASALFLLSLCDVLEGNSEKADANIVAAQKAAPDEAILKLAKQTFYFYADETVDLRQLEQLTSDATVKPLAFFALGNISAAKAEYEKALANWKRAEGIIPGFVMDGMTPAAVQSASSPEEQKYISLGMLLYLKNLFEPALAEFDKALKQNPESFLANFLYALTLIQIDTTNDPSGHLVKSTQSAPKFFPANYMLAEHYLKRNDVAKALSHYIAATESFPDQGALIKLALIYENQGKLKQAESTYRAFIQHHPESFLGYNQLAWLYAQQGVNLEEALDLASKADELRPENASINDTIGWLRYLSKQYSSAEQHLRKANEISRRENPEILYHLAVVLEVQGKIAEAKQLLQRALKLSDRFTGVENAKQLSKKLGVTVSR